MSNATEERNDLNRAIGELIGEVRGINRRLDEFLKDHATIEGRVEKNAARIGKLENRISWAQGAAWAAAGLASTLGLDRLAGILTGKH